MRVRIVLKGWLNGEIGYIESEFKTNYGIMYRVRLNSGQLFPMWEEDIELIHEANL